LEQIQNKIHQKLSIKKNKIDEDIAGIKKRKQDALIMFEKGRFSAEQLTEELTRLNRYVKTDEGITSNGLMPDAVQRKELGSRIAMLGKVQKMPTVQQYQFFQEIIDHIEVNEYKEILGIYLKGWDQNILDVEDKE
jgi:ribonucleotide monophosphatase NagD (HAD superfamily)